MEFSMESFLMGAGFGGFAGVIYLLNAAFFRVEEGHKAALTRFGRALKVGSSLRLFGPGGHWKWPWDKVITFSVMERVIDLTGEDGGQSAMAGDGTLLRLDSKIRFRPLAEKAYSFLFELKNPMQHIRGTFVCIIRNEIANFGPADDAEKSDEILGAYHLIRRDRYRLNEQVDRACLAQLGAAHGIQFCGVDLIDIVPPHELETALNGIQNARAEAETLYAKAEADSRRRLAAAERYVGIQKTRAEASTAELAKVAEVISDLVTDGNIDNFIDHKRTELFGNSRIIFQQRQVR
jgi:regulator of protease activity HflC (stomatin/prohibitin superfamily)